MRVEELMTTDVATVERNDELSVVDDLIKMKRIRHLPVVEKGRLVGIVTQRDLFQAGLSNAMGFGEKARKEFLGTVVVKEVMTDEVVTVGPDETVKNAAKKMLEHKIGCLPVVREGKLLGILTETDLVRLLVDS
ncbi:MAG TPA: CBS domain-containing protein [Vicinamibacteria bacterium]|nr:CBS domain-containing protein [Vicinamibacteria bacterium]